MFSVCVCVCVFWRSLCSKFLDWEIYFEIFVLNGSLVELYVGLHSYLCFSLLEKLYWKVGSTPPRHLLDTWWIDRESSYLDSSLTPGELIKLLFLNLILCCSIPSRYLSCRRLVPRHLPRYLPIPQLSSITERSIYSSIAILLSFLRSLSICLQLFISQTLSFSLQTFSSRFLQAFSSFSTFGKCLIPLYSCISRF